ncbi:uncharacterized protein LOC115222734, partial [Argonauta hians]
SAFLVDSATCRIPDLNPFQPDLKSFYHVRKWRPCPGNPPLVSQDGNILRVNRAVVKNRYKNSFSKCNVHPIIRVNVDDGHIKYLKISASFETETTILHDYIKLKCYDKKNKVIYTNYYAFIQRKKTLAFNNNNVLNRTESKPSLNYIPVRNNTHKNMNVLLVGVDSISRLNSIRQLSKTRRFLLDKKNTVEMLGYNKVADNTLVNVVPLLCGKYLKDLPWNETLNRKPFDKYNFIWKKYRKKGYATMYAEDDPIISAFNCAKYGFKIQPTDHYLRPICLAIYKDYSVYSRSKQCITDRSITSFVLQYIYDFVNIYNNSRPHFSFTFISDLTHNDMNNLGYADENYLRFFQKLFQNKLLTNTFVIFFSDHGLRFGKYRSTYAGKLEERLPFMFLIPPPSFIQRYPQLWRNLKSNSRRLTTPFDIHETLNDLLDLEETSKRKPDEIIDYKNRKSISLFREIPLNRSCEEATIQPHWCTCHQSKPVNITNTHVIETAQYLLKKINELTQKYRHLCERLQLLKIRQAAIIRANDKVLKYVKRVNYVINIHIQYGKKPRENFADYEVTIQTLPGNGLFEGTVRVDYKTRQLNLLGGISRTNKYGNQSHCVEAAKKFCFCKSPPANIPA